MTPESSPEPREDPRIKDVGDQLPEEQHEDAVVGTGDGPADDDDDDQRTERS
jgi:hypothetical protein